MGMDLRGKHGDEFFIFTTGLYACKSPAGLVGNPRVLPTRCFLKPTTMILAASAHYWLRGTETTTSTRASECQIVMLAPWERRCFAPPTR